MSFRGLDILRSIRITVYNSVLRTIYVTFFWRLQNRVVYRINKAARVIQALTQDS
jgi:hypothetical protein